MLLNDNLNLLTQVQFGPNTADNVQYTYTATGRKLRKQTNHQNTARAKTKQDFVGISHFAKAPFDMTLVFGCGGEERGGCAAPLTPSLLSSIHVSFRAEREISNINGTMVQAHQTDSSPKRGRERPCENCVAFQGEVSAVALASDARAGAGLCDGAACIARGIRPVENKKFSRSLDFWVLFYQEKNTKGTKNNNLSLNPRTHPLFQPY